MAVERPDLEPLVNQELTIIAWLWARTVRSPSPAFSDVDVPLASTFVFSSKAGKQIFVQPQIEGRRYQFRVKQGTPPPKAKNGTKFEGRGAEFKCIFSDVAISGEYIRTEAKAGRIGQKLMAIAADGVRGRVYLPPTEDAERTALSIEPTWKPDVEFFQRALGFRIGNYGMTTWSDLFSKRQLMALTTLNSVVSEASQLIRSNAIAAGMADDGIGLEAGGTSATAYSEAITVYLACVLDRMIYYGSSLTTWLPKDNALRDCMPRAALAMTWDFAECNPFGKSSGDFQTCLNSVSNYLNVATPVAKAAALQRDAALPADDGKKGIVSTDPPYYDNIGYADLSDYFYVWLRPILRPIFPSLFSTVTTPKADELVATPSRHGGADRAETFFLDGMTSAMRSIVMRAHPAFPVTIYYAFKQSETEIGEGTSSTGWETFLDAVLRAGFFITGTLPMRTEGAGRIRAKESNALNSSIVLVCRVRSAKAPAVSRREFLRELNVILPEALDEMTKGAGSDHSPIAPVDLSQAIIGPGMGVFSKYEAVLEADGSPMSIRVALQLINRFLAQDDFDADTQFCLLWFEQHSWGEGPYGDADKLSRGKGTSVDGMKDAAVLRSGGGTVRLLKWAEYPTDWDPRADDRVPIWEALHQLIRALKQDGEAASGVLLSALGGKADAVRQLAYRLYTLCERLGQAEDARAYNELITSWTGIESAASIVPKTADQQELLF
jgi:putative DNA methylase